jgi:hypothetical protein
VPWSASPCADQGFSVFQENSHEPTFRCLCVNSARILFILKRRSCYEQYNNGLPYGCYADDFSSGLLNSVRFLVDMLTDAGIECKMVQVVDNNSIDREVTLYKPTHAIIEALWVVPEKFDVLQRLHPRVEWIVRLHSEIPFLANEGIAMDWITRYASYENVTVAANSVIAVRDLSRVLAAADRPGDGVLYLPNYYPYAEVSRLAVKKPRTPGEIAVGCFGAIRPMKNNLIQAIAAIEYAEANGLELRFHVNAGRSEQGGDNNLRNLRALFHATHHTLIEHPWMDHTSFLDLVKQMELSMCVSFSESFCIVAADSIALGVPTIMSPEIEWASRFAMAHPTSTGCIVAAINRMLKSVFRRWGVRSNRVHLRNYCEAAKEEWLEQFA